MTSFDEPGSLVNDLSVHMEDLSSPQPFNDEEKCTKIGMYEQQIRIFDARKDYLLNMLEIEKTGPRPSTATMEKLNAEMRNIDEKIKNLEGKLNDLMPCPVALCNHNFKFKAAKRHAEPILRPAK
ncbi:hypothetical protein TNCT_508511 [Trichonephila clavata]|uniref:Uncharacterized protein n=1 Tax=Trichonephila clavata TaxID=2740835 RepID=A0A8X6FDZ9_TRICU|nr:hypothetical protein TNCT_508511 [Trichonephila clavata]